MPEIDITIAKDGTVRVEVNGVSGPACLMVSKAIEEALGKAGVQELKAEYYEAIGVAEEVRLSE